MQARMAPSKEEKDDFSRLLREVCAGTVPFASLQEHSYFLRRGKQICRRVVRGYSDAGYDAEDLFVDTCLKILTHEASFIREGRLTGTEESASGNVSDDDAFFKRFLVFAAGIFRLRLRTQRPRAWIDRWHYDAWSYSPLISFVSIGECRAVEDPGVDLEGGCLLREFLEFIGVTLPHERRRAVEMWLEDYSLREIEKSLNGDGITCSRAAIRRWIADSLKSFVAPRNH